MTRFANLADGGRHLVAPLRKALAEFVDPLLVAVLPNGVPVAAPIAAGLELAIVGVALDRGGEPRVIEVPDVTGRTCVVVDDGVETGTAAQLVGSALRAAGAERLLLAVPVCPRQSEAQLQQAYDGIIALDRPLGRRDLRWHYETFDTIDEAEARRRLADR